MLKKIIILQILFCGLVLSQQPPAYDEPLKIMSAADSTNSLTLQSAINIAFQNNLNIKIAHKDLMKNQYAVDEFSAALLPSLSAKSHFLFAPESGYDPAVTNGGEYGLQLSIDYTLYNGGLNNLAVEKANKNISISDLNIELAKSELKLRVRSVFYEIENAQREN